LCAFASEGSAAGKGAVGVWLPSVVLLGLLAFFAASEVAFFSLHALQLRTMRESDNPASRLVGRLMDHPGDLLTSILMGSCAVNVLLGVVLGAHIEEVFHEAIPLPAAFSYAFAVLLTTAVVLLIGDVLPKVAVVYNAETFARAAAVPLFVIDRLLWPIRANLIRFVGFLFRVTRFSEVRPAPFMTNDEFLALLYEGEVSGAIEEEERNMIEGIMEFSDVMVNEVLVPRPDMVAIKADATVGDAMALVRAHDYSRLPVQQENLDHIVGVLCVKDLLPSVMAGDFDQPVARFMRPAHFVPETMTVSNFVKSAQRKRTHLAIVVDEYGGTEGLVTLQDALREVVGDIGEERDAEPAWHSVIREGVYRVKGGMPLSALEELIGRPVQDEEHTTVAGFLMNHSDRILARGDVVDQAGVTYVIEETKGRRVSRVRVEVKQPASEEGAP
jgi:CBS domain containing-hemolysin-like protein